MSCPRSFFYNYVLGWEKISTRNDLWFGVSWHLIMEHFLEHGTKQESIAPAYKRFLNKYRQKFPPETDDAMEVKTPANALLAAGQYVSIYEDDSFEVLHTEVAGSVTVDRDTEMYFKIDGICRDERGVFILEHKTTKSFNYKYADQWRLKTQVGVYTHALYSFFPSEEVYGLVINATAFKSPPRFKKNGEPYANSGTGNEFMRIPIRKDPKSMQVWLQTTQWWISQLKHDFEELSASSPSDEIMSCFPMNTENCTKYFGCPYHPYCIAWNNPLQNIDRLPMDFEVRFWDPREKEETAKEVVRL
jgi:hypothetical protein